MALTLSEKPASYVATLVLVFLWGVTEGRCVLCRLKVADSGRDALGSGSWSDGGTPPPEDLLGEAGELGF